LHRVLFGVCRCRLNQLLWLSKLVFHLEITSKWSIPLMEPFGYKCQRANSIISTRRVSIEHCGIWVDTIMPSLYCCDDLYVPSLGCSRSFLTCILLFCFLHTCGAAELFTCAVQHISGHYLPTLRVIYTNVYASICLIKYVCI
jgi:hypothetical protein